MVLPIDSRYQDLLEAAGRGRFRLELVGADRKAIPGAPVACTGDLGDDDDLDHGDDEDGYASEEDGSRGSRKGLGKNELLSQLLQSNARMTASALHQVTAVLSGAAQLVTAAHGAGLTNRPAVPTAQPVAVGAFPPPDVADDLDNEDGGDDSDLDGDAVGDGSAGPDDPPSGGLPDWVQLIIKQTVATVAPLVVERLASTFASMPLGSLTDWRKAVPPVEDNARPQDFSATHVGPTPPPMSTHAPASPITWASADATGPDAPWRSTAAAPTTRARQNAYAHAQATNALDSTLRSVTTMHQRSAIADTQPEAISGSRVVRAAEPTGPTPPPTATFAHVPATDITARPPLDGVTTAGAASRGPSTREAAPAEADQAGDHSARANDHFTVVWNALPEAERQRAVKLIARLSPDARAALVAELSSLPLEEAIARARSIIRGRTPTT
jgi:hypothetical protein